MTRLALPPTATNLVTDVAALLVASHGANLGSAGGPSRPAHVRPTLSSLPSGGPGASSLTSWALDLASEEARCS